jgi:hypothetical protein
MSGARPLARPLAFLPHFRGNVASAASKVQVTASRLQSHRQSMTAATEAHKMSEGHLKQKCAQSSYSPATHLRNITLRKDRDHRLKGIISIAYFLDPLPGNVANSLAITIGVSSVSVFSRLALVCLEWWYPVRFRSGRLV